ncbi:MAG: PKD domain-containing protein [Bacteroidia bacterium]
MKRFLLYLFLGIGMSLSGFAQGTPLSGTVTDLSNQPIDNFPVFYLAIDTASGLVDSGVVVTNPAGLYSATLVALPLPSTIIELSWQDCNTWSSASYLGQTSIVHDIQTCATPCNAWFNFSTTPMNPQAYGFFTNPTSGGSYTWDLGDGTIATGPQVSHVYSITGPITACLYYDNGAGCVDTSCQTFIVSGQSGNCDASFTSNPIANSNSVVLNPVNIAPGTYYEWSLGDGSISTTPTYTHTYAQPGVYTVCLLAYDSSISCIDTTCQTLVINGGGGGNCDATFSFAPDTITAGNPYVYNFFPASPTLISSYAWDFGDGNTSASPYPLHAYNSPGVYTVCLIISDPSGCTDTSCLSLTVAQYTPNCDANFTAFPLGQLTAFSVNFPDPNLNYQWTLGDGNVANGSSIVYQYANPDTFQVCLIASDSINGTCADTVCQMVVAGGGPANCDASFGSYPDTSLQNPFSYFFYPFQNTPTLNYSWDFGDGSSSSQSYPNHTYNAPGIYNVCLAVDDGLGCVDTSCVLLTVTQGNPGGCDPTFFASSPQMNPQGGAFITFTAFSNMQASYLWDFGDGNTGFGHQTNHLYSAAGTYNACLIVTGQNGCSDTSCQSIIIPPIGVPCSASFTSMVAPNNLVNLSADFSGYSNYFWDLGDGNTATSENVSHTYAAAGTYTVCLTVSDSASNCVDSLCHIVQTSQIQPPPGFAVLGQVWAGNQVADDFTAWLIVYDSAAGTLAAVDTFVSDSSNFGFFFFVAPNGDYRVKASLNASSSQYASYLPTYYGDELFWNNAIVVNQQTFPFVQINLIAGNNPGGPGFVGGLVSQGANKAEGDPLAGMHVLVTNDQGDAVMHTTTDEDGEYELDNLAYGTYHIYIEIWGRNLEHHTITIAPGAETHTDVDFEVTDDDVTASGTTGIDDLLDPLSLQIFPNPISGEQDLNVTLSLKQSAEVNFSLHNMVGQTVINQTERMIAGPQAKSLQVSSLPAGVYFLRMNVNGESMSPIKVVIQ